MHKPVYTTAVYTTADYIQQFIIECIDSDYYGIGEIKDLKNLYSQICINWVKIRSKIYKFKYAVGYIPPSTRFG